MAALRSGAEAVTFLNLVNNYKMEANEQIIKDFCDKHGLIYTLSGECGFGRECVGVLSPESDNYVEYNPTRHPHYDNIEHLYSEKHFGFVPENAYHKHTCMAVLGRDEESVRQLAEWCQKLEAAGVTVERYETGATGIQALISGKHNYALRLPD